MISLLLLGITLSGGIALAFVLGFLTSYTQYEQKLINFAPDILVNFIKIRVLGRTIEPTETGKEIDPILNELISKPPEYTYNSNYEEFLRNFDDHKEKSLNFPTKEHESLINSDQIGDVSIGEEKHTAGVKILNISIPVVGGNIPGLVVKPLNSSNNPVIVCPGHPENEDPLEDLINKNSYQKGIAIELAKEGYTVFCMGLRGFNTSSLGSKEFDAIASMKGYSWYGFLTSDAIVFRQHIVEKFGYDSSDIGFIGLSTGGAVSMFASAIDHNVPYAIVCGFFGSFSYNFVEENHSNSGNIHNILNYFEMRDYLIGTNADQIHVINGEGDTFSSEHAKKEFEKVQQACQGRETEPHLKFHSPAGVAHEYDVELVKKIIEDVGSSWDP